MRRFVILASVVVLAASSAACGGNSSDRSSNILGPSMVSDYAAVSATGKGKPGGGGTSPGGGSLSLAPIVIDNNHDGLPNFGDTVTFTVQTSATAYPWVTLKCYQNGTLVGQESNGIFATSLSRDFTLGPTPLWTGGTANCTATLENWDSYSKNGSITALASMSFRVD